MKKKGKEQMTPRTVLQIRVLHQDQKGSIHDVTQDAYDGGYGLRGLQMRSSSAYDGLLRMREILGLLDLAVENREQVDTALVRRVLREAIFELSRGGDLGGYVQCFKELFEDTHALPPTAGVKPLPDSRSLALVS